MWKKHSGLLLLSLLLMQGCEMTDMLYGYDTSGNFDALWTILDRILFSSNTSI